MQITLDITDKEVKILKDSILDIEEWVNNAVQGKINNCKKRLIDRELVKAAKEGVSIPSNEDQMIDAITNRKNYKDRKTRDEEKIKERDKNATTN